VTWVAIGTLASALAAMVYAFYARGKDTDRIVKLTEDRLADGKAMVADGRNALLLEKARDTEKARADLAESQLADVTAQLKSTQAALVKAQGEEASDAAEKVKNAPDPLAELNRQLSSSARSDVPAAGDPGAGNGHQG
jgi:hypothetical protein